MAQNQSQFGILEASIILSSVKNEDKVVDVRGNIVEVNLFENLYKPYVDSTIVLIDDFGLKNSLNIQGTERLKLVLGDAENPEEPVVVKYFFFSKINDTQKMNERAELLSISLVEEHVYIDAIKQFSKSYTDELENIITSIADNELGKTVVKSLFEPSVQGPRKIIVPYLSPLEAIQWLRDRATTRTGSPIFLSGSLYTNSLVMSSLDGLLREDVINDKLPLRYSSAISGVDADQDQLRPYYEIMSFKEVDAENSLALYENGAIGSFYASIDAGTGVLSGEHISVRDILDEFYTNKLISADTNQSVFDPSLEIDGKLSDEYNSLHIHQVVSSNTYNQFKSYHDETSLLGENNSLIESRLKAKNKIIRTFLKKNIIDIGMNGSLFFKGKISVGRKLRLLFLNSNVQGDLKDTNDQIDKRKSGDYIILATNHRLADEKHTTILRLTKLGELPKDFRV
tara:strand:+ start:1235 stop:2599 length:1365 start_codon:yes stop_codon:yes gene_type:complete